MTACIRCGVNSNNFPKKLFFSQMLVDMADVFVMVYATTECRFLASTLVDDHHDNIFNYAGFVEYGVEVKKN